MKTRILQLDNIFTPQVQIKCYSQWEWRNFTLNNPWSSNGNKIIKFSSLKDAKDFLTITLKSRIFVTNTLKKQVSKTVFEQEI